MRPPVDNRLKNTSSWANFAEQARPPDARRLEARRRRVGMSELERKLAGDGLVITGELPVVDGGGHGRRAPAARAVRAVGRRDQRDRQHRRARARLQRRGRDRAQAARRRADHADRLPRQEPARDPGRHRRRRAARHREHLLPDRRRRDRGRRAGGAPRLRPRRPAADRHGGRDRARRVPLGPQRSSRRRTSSSAPSRTRARRRSPTAPSARSRRRAPARASCSCRSVTSPPQLEAFCAEGARVGLVQAHGAPALDLPRRGRAAARVHGRRRARHLGARGRRSSASRTPPIRATRPSSLPSSRRGTPSRNRASAGLHLISFRKDDAVGRLCERLGIPTTKERDASGHGSAVTV